MSTNNINITITEKQLLHALYDNLKLLDTLSIDEFITDVANEFYGVFIKLYDLKLEVIPEHILKYKSEFIKIETLTAIIDTKYQLDSIDQYVKEIKEYSLYKNLEEKVLKDTLYELGKKNTTNRLEILTNCYQQFGNTLQKLKSDNNEEKEYLTFENLISDHKEVITERSKIIKQTTGCPNFDLLLPQIVPGLVIIAGYSGSCKSTLLMYLERQRVIKRLNCIAINTEMAKTAYNDSLFPSFLKVNYYDMLGINKKEDIDYDYILSRMNEIENKYSGKSNYLYLNKYDASIDDLEKFAIFAREFMNLDKSKTLFCFIDLLSMIKDFNLSKSGFNKADSIELGVNRLNEFCLKNNVLTIGTLQLKRKDDTKRIERLDQIENYRCNASDIKSSGSWEERARIVMSVFNPWSIVHRNPTSQVIRDSIDPIIDVDINKDNYFSQSGKRIQYLYQENYKTFIPYYNNEENK